MSELGEPFETMLPDLAAAMGNVRFVFERTAKKDRLRPREMVLFAADMASVARELGVDAVRGTLAFYCV